MSGNPRGESRQAVELRPYAVLGLDRIWLQPGPESKAAIAFCHQNNLKVVHDVCVMAIS